MDFNLLKPYARFILDHHLEELVSINIARAREVDLPLLKLFKGYSEEQLFEYSRNSVRTLLTDLAEGLALRNAQEGLHRWKTDQIPNVSKAAIDAKDVAFSPHTRKYSLIKLLRRYTQDLDLYEAIVQELELFFTSILSDSLATFVEIQQETLQKEKDFFQTVIDNTDDGITAFDSNLRITLWNRAVETRSGYPRDAMLGRLIFDQMPGYRNSNEGQAMVNALKGKRISLRDMPYQDKEGYYESDLIPLRNAAQEVVGLLAISRDITARRKEAEKIIRSEAMMAQAQSAAHFGSWEQDLLTGEISWSDELYRIYGYEPQSLPVDATLLNQLWHPDDQERLKAVFQSLITNPQPFEITFRIVRKDGVERIIQTQGDIVTDEQGKLIKLYGASQDITRQKETEATLLKNKSRLKEAQAMAHLGHWEMQLPDQRITWSDELYRIFELVPGTTLSLDQIFELIHPADVPMVQTAIRRGIEHGEPFDFELRICPASGTTKFLRCKGRTESNAEGHIVRLLGVSQDITEQKLAQQEIFDKNRILSQTLEELRITQDSVLKLNRALEEKVIERTRELAASEEELRQTLDQAVDLNNQLVERENFLSSILDQSPLSTWITDAAGNLIRNNNASVQLFGAINKQPTFQPYNILRDKIFSDSAFFPEIQAVFKEGRVAKFDLAYDPVVRQYPNESAVKPIFLRVTIFPIRNSQGQIINAVAQHEDITERKQAVEDLKNSEEQMRLVTDALPVAISHIDTRERFVFTNQTYEHWFGLSRIYINGKTLIEVLGEPAYNTVRPFVQRALAGEEIYFENEVSYQYGGRRAIAANLIPRFQDGKVLGYYALITDITERKQAQDALQKALEETSLKNQELVRINADLDNFVYTASHDLKSPMVSLEGLLTVLNRKISTRLDESEKKIIELMNVSLSKFKKTITGLVDVTRAQKNLEEERIAVSVQQLVEEVKTDIAEQISEAGALIHEDFRVPQIRFNPSNLRSILYNLLSNAIKYRSPDRTPEIRIFTYHEGPYTVLCVQDNGLGINAEYHSKVFSMFKRLHTHVEGTGVGLYIIKRIVENSKGQIELESEEGKGSLFRVYFNNDV
jgi:PAS domain S-box-containing protein